jgi:hypothetical protein
VKKNTGLQISVVMLPDSFAIFPTLNRQYTRLKHKIGGASAFQ